MPVTRWLRIDARAGGAGHWFEKLGGTGNHAACSRASAPRGPGSRAISTAIGYNELLTTNSSVSNWMAEQGDESQVKLTAKAGDAVGRAAQGDG